SRLTGVTTPRDPLLARSSMVPGRAAAPAPGTSPRMTRPSTIRRSQIAMRAERLVPVILATALNWGEVSSGLFEGTEKGDGLRVLRVEDNQAPSIAARRLAASGVAIQGGQGGEDVTIIWSPGKCLVERAQSRVLLAQ